MCVVYNAAFNPLFLSARASAFVGWCRAHFTDTVQIAFISRLPFFVVAPPSHLVQNSGKGLQHPLKHSLRCYGNESCITPWRFFLQSVIRYHTPTLHWICKCICTSWVCCEDALAGRFLNRQMVTIVPKVTGRFTQIFFFFFTFVKCVWPRMHLNSICCLCPRLLKQQ